MEKYWHKVDPHRLKLGFAGKINFRERIKKLAKF